MLLKCIKQARKMNHTMLADLRARTEGWADRIEVSDIFVHFAAVCPQTYGGYARSHARTIETLGSEVFAEFKHAYREETGEPMATTLIKPVQWVVRVLLLLKDLQKKTGEAHSDHAGLAESISAMEKSCNTVNHFVWVRENKQKNLALQKQIVGMPPDLKLVSEEERSLVLRAPLLKQCKRRPKPYTFLLFSDLLIYGGALGGERLRYHRHLELAYADVREREGGCTDRHPILREWADGAHAFLFEGKHKSFVVYTKSAAQAQEWMSELSDAIGATRALHNIRSSDVTRAAAWQPDKSQNCCSIAVCGKKFTMMTRRHHCRMCGRLVCDECSKHRSVLVHIHATKKQRICNICVAKEAIGLMGRPGDSSPGRA